MSETIGEMILPGTYIDVRAEGLIGVGGISTGNVGIVGTANRGPLNEVKLLGSYSEALDTFGSYDAWAGATSLSLTRALEQLFSGGASTVYAVRVANVVGTACWPRVRAIIGELPAVRSRSMATCEARRSWLLTTPAQRCTTTAAAASRTSWLVAARCT